MLVALIQRTARLYLTLALATTLQRTLSINMDTPPSRFLALPAELRVYIYDAVLEPLGGPEPRDIESSLLSDDYPQQTSFNDYLALVLASKLISAKIIDHFHRHYLSRIALYTSNIHQLRHSALHSRLHNQPIHEALRFCLRVAR